MVESKKFIEFAKKQIVKYYNQHADVDNKEIGEDDVFIVWYCKTLQNKKALLSTTIPDGCYYEITFNGDKKEAYIDVYKKWENFCVENV